MLVNTISLQVFSQCSLDSLIKGRKVRSGIEPDVPFVPVYFLHFCDIVTHLHVIERDLSVHAGSFNNQTAVVSSIHIDGKVTVVLSGHVFLVLVSFLLLLLFLHWLIIRQRLPI